MTNIVDPHLPPDYVPSESEEYMNPRMTAYFRQRLLDWRDELLDESENTLDTMRAEGGIQEPDINDRATAEIDHGLEQGEYGYCEETGDAIGVKRLLARPNATLSIEAQERHEREEKVKRDD